jgi:hypothetical protein
MLSAMGVGGATERSRELSNGFVCRTVPGWYTGFLSLGFESGLTMTMTFGGFFFLLFFLSTGSC